MNTLVKVNTVGEIVDWMVHSGEQEIKEIASIFKNLVDRVVEMQNKVGDYFPAKQEIIATIVFNEEEIAEMEERFREIFIRNGACARVIKSFDGYNILYRRDGYNISVYSVNLREAKEKFIQGTKLKNIKIGA